MYNLIIDNTVYGIVIDDDTDLFIDCHVYLDNVFHIGFGIDTRYNKNDVFIYRMYEDGRYCDISFSDINKFNEFSVLVNGLYNHFKKQFKRLP